MSNQPPRVPDEYDEFFRGKAPKDSGKDGAPPTPEELDKYEAFLRSAPQPAQRRAAPPGARSSAAAPTERITPAGTVAPPRPASPPPTRLPKPKRKKPLWRRILRWLFLALVVLIAYVLGLLLYLVVNINKIDAIPPDQIPNTPGSVTLLVGSDERSADPDSGSRTDTIMLLVDPTWGPPTLVSIPRDSWVEIPGEGEDKINASFSIGGPQLLVDTIELNTGLHVDHYVEVGFEGIVWLTDAVGGVELCIDYDVNDPNSGLVMEAGCSVLDGQQALAFCRMRYSDPNGDLGRIERQQQWIESFVKTVMQPQNLLNPATMIDVMDAAAAALTVDEDTGAFNMARMAWGVVQIGRGKGALTTVPIADSAAYINGKSVVLWDEEAAQQLFESLGAE